MFHSVSYPLAFSEMLQDKSFRWPFHACIIVCISALRIDLNEMQRILVCVNFRETIELQKYQFISTNMLLLLLQGTYILQTDVSLVCWHEGNESILL